MRLINRPNKGLLYKYYEKIKELITNEFGVTSFTELKSLFDTFIAVDRKYANKSITYEVSQIKDDELKFSGYQYTPPVEMKNKPVVLYHKLNRDIILEDININHGLIPKPLLISTVPGLQIFYDTFTEEIDIDDDDEENIEHAICNFKQLSPGVCFADGFFLSCIFDETYNHVTLSNYKDGYPLWSITLTHELQGIDDNSWIKVLSIEKYSKGYISHRRFIDSGDTFTAHQDTRRYLYGINNFVGPYFDGVQYYENMEYKDIKWSSDKPEQQHQMNKVTLKHGFLDGECILRTEPNHYNDQLHYFSLMSEIQDNTTLLDNFQIIDNKSLNAHTQAKYIGKIEYTSFTKSIYTIKSYLHGRNFIMYDTMYYDPNHTRPYMSQFIATTSGKLSITINYNDEDLAEINPQDLRILFVSYEVVLNKGLKTNEEKIKFMTSQDLKTGDVCQVSSNMIVKNRDKYQCVSEGGRYATYSTYYFDGEMVTYQMYQQKVKEYLSRQEPLFKDNISDLSNIINQYTGIY